MSDKDPIADEERRLAALLREAGRRPQPSQAQLERWQAQFQSELGARRRWWSGRAAGVAVAACAALLAVAVLLLPEQAAPPPAAPVAEVVTAFGGNVARAGTGDGGPNGRSLAAGDAIAVGERVESGLYSGLGLRYQGADLRLDASTTVVFAAERIELVTGRVYVDTGEGFAQKTVRVHTPLGWFEHVGTQFLVAVVDGEVHGAVREGRIVLHHDGAELLLSAAADAARLIVVDDGVTRESAVPTSGDLWAWTEASSAGLDLSGLSADEVLRWVARERGQRLDYASPAVRRAAENARQRGTAGVRLGPAEALEVINLSTQLRVRAQGDRLSVSLASEADEDAD